MVIDFDFLIPNFYGLVFTEISMSEKYFGKFHHVTFAPFALVISEHV